MSKIHPAGEWQTDEVEPPEGPLSLDAFAGKIQFRWAPERWGKQLGAAAVLHRVFEDQWAVRRVGEGLPAGIHEPERTTETGCAGDVLLSVLAGHWRYAHMSALRFDGVNPELLGMSKVATEDSVRRALSRSKRSKASGG